MKPVKVMPMSEQIEFRKKKISELDEKLKWLMAFKMRCDSKGVRHNIGEVKNALDFHKRKLERLVLK